MRNLLIISLSIWGCLLATACTFDSSALLERTPCELDQDCPGGVCIEQFCFFGEVLDPADVALTPDSFNLDTGLVPDTGGDTSANDTDSDISSTICSPGIARCNGTVLEVCSGDGTELTEVDCAESECDDPRGLGCVCARGTCTGRVCERGETICDSAGTGFLTCNDAGTDYVQGRACPTGTTCLQSGFEALCSEGGCEPDRAQCSGTDVDTVQICNSDGTGFSAFIPCSPDQFCADGVCVPDICTPGEAECVDSFTISVCDARGVRFVTAPCDPGTYCDTTPVRCLPTACSPGERRCADSVTPEVCRADGSGFDTLAVCADATVCAGGACTPIVCEPGSVSCDSPTARAVCNALGTAVSVASCPDGQNCSDGVCSDSICTPASTFCEDGDVLRCNSTGSAVSLLQTCSFGCAEGACLPARCGDGVLSPERGETCDDGNLNNCDGCPNNCVINYVARLTSSSRTAGATWAPGSSNLTVEGWFNVSSVSGALFGVYSPGGDAAYLRVVNGRAQFVFNLSDTATSVLTSPDFIRGTGWHHIAGVRVGPGLAYLFIDGRPVDGAIVTSNDTSIDGTQIFVGGMTGLPSADFQASQLRLGSHARYTTLFAPPRDAAANTTSRVAGYALDTGSGNLVENLGGDARDMTVSALSWQPDTCYGSDDTAVTCGDGELAPWEFCEPAMDPDCTEACGPELVCDRSIAVDGACIRPYPAGRSFADNEALCVDFGGHIMTIDNGLQQTSAAVLMNEFGIANAWIGLNDRASEGRFVWLDGTPLSYTDWDTGQPDNAPNTDPNGEDCAVMARDRGFKWADFRCGLAFSALCYRPGPFAP